MSALEQVQFTHVEGKPDQSKSIEVFALSTCAFCERALAWLKDKNFSYDYVFLDQLDPEFKRQVKGELKEKHGNIPVFPLIILDKTEAISGFSEEKYEGLFNFS